MTWRWGDLWHQRQKWLKAGWLITAAWVAIYIGVIEPREIAREVEAERSTGLGTVAGPISILPSRRAKLISHLESYRPALSGGYADRARMASMFINGSASPARSENAQQDRKLVRTGSMQLVVESPVEIAEKIRQLAERMHGYIESSQVNGIQTMANASVVIRVPATRLEETRAEIRKMGGARGS
jgi:hypothetical protein